MTAGIEFFKAGLRVWRRSAGVSFLAAAAIAVATALLLSMTSVIWGVFEADLPGVEARGLYRVHLSDPEAGALSLPVSPSEYLAWTREPELLDAAGAFVGASFTLTGDGRPALRANGAYVTPSLLAMTGARPLLGGLFSGEAQDRDAVLLSHDAWTRHFGGDPAIVGRAVEIEGRARSVVGVMPPEFRFPLNQYVWLPLEVDPEVGWQRSRLQMVVRLERAADLGRVRARLEASLRGLDPETGARRRVRVDPFLEAYTDPTFRGYLAIMAWAAFGVLLVAAANVSGLLASRAVARQPEDSLRRALGASGRDLVWAPLGEAASLALVGGAAGLWLAVPVLARLDALLRENLHSYWIDVGVDARSVALTAAAIGLCVLLTATLPVLTSLRGKSGPGASSVRRRGTLARFLRLTLILQIAISSGILFPTSALVQSLWSLARHRPAIATGDVVRAQISLPWASYEEVPRRLGFYRALRERLEGRGFESVALASTLPGDPLAETRLEARGVDRPEPERVAWQIVAPEILDVFDLELVAGRRFDGRDRPEAPGVAWITESLARSLYGSPEAAVGRGVRFVENGSESQWMTVVGVAPDALVAAGIPKSQTGVLPTVVRDKSVERAVVFRPLSQSPAIWLSVAAETSLSFEAATARMREVVRDLDPLVPLFWEKTYEQVIATRTWDYRLFGKLFIVLGVATLAMTILGLFGVASLLVRERASEIAVRKAIGATRGAIMKMIFAYGAATVAAGLLFGHLIGHSGGGFLRALFFQVESLDLRHFTAVDLTFAIVAGLALWLPALRAARISPAELLRRE